jgi:hypothetical protein
MKSSKQLFVLLGLALGLFLSGCASMSSQKAPNTDLSTLKSFYVVQLAADERGIDKVIAGQLIAMGFTATNGKADQTPQNVDAIITYQDRWMWDLSMYMMELNIQVRAPKTQMTLASGKSFRPSLQRRSPEEMAKEVLTSIFAQK